MRVIDHFLLDGEQSPLKIGTPEMVMGPNDERLERVAGEKAEKRGVREGAINNPAKATKVLQG